MKVGIDLDGVISSNGLFNPSLPIPYWFFIFLIPFFYFAKPTLSTRRKLKNMRESNCEILIISARPAKLFNLTEKWLVKNYIPFDKLFCVGFGKGTKKRKLEVIEREKIDLFIDDDPKIIRYLTKNSVHSSVFLEAKVF